MTGKRRRSFEAGHRPKFLVVVDDSEECGRAVYFAARRAVRIAGGMVMLAVTERGDYQHWLGVGDVMKAEAEAEAEALLDRFAAPLALILGILSLVLYAMLRVTLGQWRRQQRRETLEAKHAAAAAQAAATETSAAVADSAARLKRAEALVLAATSEPEAAVAVPAAPAPDHLSPAQRLEVERLVSQRVDEELRWLRANLPELVASAVAASAVAPPEMTAAANAQAATETTAATEATSPTTAAAPTEPATTSETAAAALAPTAGPTPTPGAVADDVQMD